MSSYTNSTLFDFLLALGAFLLGGFGVYLTFRFSARRAIKLFVEQSTALTQAFQSVVPELAITLGSDQINGRIVMLKLALANTGNMDVAESMIHQPLRIGLPEGWRWLKYTIDERSTCPVTLSQPVTTALELAFDLFKASDVIFLQLVAEAPADADLQQDKVVGALSLSSRIQDIGPIGKVIAPSGRGTRFEVVISVALVLGWLATIAISVAEVAQEEGLKSRILFAEYVEGKPSSTVAEVISGQNNSLKLVEVERGFLSKVMRLGSEAHELARYSSGAELFGDTRWHPIVEFEPRLSLTTAVLPVAMVTFMLAVVTWPLFSAWRIRKILRSKKRA